MAETLRELVVALSLDSSNFSRNMRTTIKQIKEAESTFRLAGAGVENYEKTIVGTEAKLSVLGQKLTQRAKAGRNASAATSPSSPAATASAIVPTAAQQPNKPGAGRNSAATGSGRKHRRDRYPLERKKSRKINASQAPHRGRTTKWSSCLKFIELAVTKTWRKTLTG